jgi:hypothetical protein
LFERERFVGVCYRATTVFGKEGRRKRVRSVRDGPGDEMIRRIITRFSAGLSSSLLRSLTNYLQGIDCCGFLQQGKHQLSEVRVRKVVLLNYFFAPRIASFFGLISVRDIFSELPKSRRDGSPFFLAAF